MDSAIIDLKDVKFDGAPTVVKPTLTDNNAKTIPLSEVKFDEPKDVSVSKAIKDTVYRDVIGPLEVAHSVLSPAVEFVAQVPIGLAGLATLPTGYQNAAKVITETSKALHSVVGRDYKTDAGKTAGQFINKLFGLFDEAGAYWAGKSTNPGVQAGIHTFFNTLPILAAGFKKPALVKYYEYTAEGLPVPKKVRMAAENELVKIHKDILNKVGKEKAAELGTVQQNLKRADDVIAADNVIEKGLEQLKQPEERAKILDTTNPIEAKVEPEIIVKEKPETVPKEPLISIEKVYRKRPEAETAEVPEKSKIDSLSGMGEQAVESKPLSSEKLAEKEGSALSTKPPETSIEVPDITQKEILAEEKDLLSETTPKPKLKASQEAFLEAMKKDKEEIPDLTVQSQESQYRPALMIDDKVYVSESPTGTTHGMLYNDLPPNAIKNSTTVKSGWALPDGTGFAKTPPKASEGGDITLTSGIDVTKIPEMARGVRDSTKAVWDAIEQKSPSVRRTRKTAKQTFKYIKDIWTHPEDFNDPGLKQSVRLLLSAEEGKNAFIHKHLTPYNKATKGIKKNSIEDTHVGEALDGSISPESLTPKEREAYNFFKGSYDFLINYAARKMAGSDEAYTKIVKEVGVKHPKKSKLADLSPEKAEEYAILQKEANQIRAGKKVSELTTEQKKEYAAKRQEMRDLLNKDYVDTLSPGEREAYVLLSRRIDQYLPHLFDQKELLEALKIDLESTRLKLDHAEIKLSKDKSPKAKGAVTRYKQRVLELENAIAKMEGGKSITFKQLPKEIFFRFFLPRKGRSGYSLSASSAYEAYIYGLSRKLFDEPAVKTISEELYKNTSPGYKPYLEDLVRHYMGYDRHPLDGLANAITTFQWIRTLGFNPRSAVVNLTQRINTFAVGRQYAAKALTMDRKLADKLFDETGIVREVPSVLTEGPPSRGLKTVNDAARYMFNKVELGNRKHAFLTGYVKGKAEGTKKGLSNEALEAYAKKEGIKLVHETQFRYGKLGMPKVYWNPINRVALQFTSYPVKQARFLYRLWKRDKQSFLIWLALAEGGNLTIQQLLDMDLSNALGIGISWGEALNSVFSLAEGDERGALRHAKQTINSGSGLLPSGFGPTATGLMNVADAVHKGNGVEAIKKELTPVALKRLLDSYTAVKFENDGRYPIYNEKGQLKYYLSGKELLQRTIGPRTTLEFHRSQDFNARKNLEQEMSEVLYDITDAIIKGDKEAAVDLMQRYGISPTDEMINNERKRRLLSEEERRTLGKKEMYQILREGKIY